MWFRIILAGCVLLGFVTGIQGLESCYEGCSDSHFAESAGNGKCKVWTKAQEVVKHCRHDTYDLVVNPEDGPCTIVAPTNTIKEWSCECAEKCVNNGESKREMEGIDYADISSKCSGTYVERKQHDCTGTST